MAFPTTNAQTELAAVNEILAAVGQAPVTTLEQTNPDVSIAYDTLKNVSREVQAEGWSFNKEHHYPFSPDSNKEILIANNILQIDLTTRFGDKDVCRRNGKLYDKAEHTYTFEDKVECDVVWLFDWVDLPVPIQDYIVAKAAAITSSRIVGDPTQFQILSQREQTLRANALEYDCNQADYTFFGHPEGENFYLSYQPYKALYR
tara:strand:- start:6390 stop:6998 length:609 start_codon:yes stop_codon:yes gene_type:complete